MLYALLDKIMYVHSHKSFYHDFIMIVSFTFYVLTFEQFNIIMCTNLYPLFIIIIHIIIIIHYHCYLYYY